MPDILHKVGMKGASLDGVYKALATIEGLSGWWTSDTRGESKVGGVMIPSKKVVWTVVDNYFGFIKDKTEWKGTDIVFEIARKGGKTEVKFTHVGLIPEYECYDVCSDAWSGLLNGTLRGLIADGSTPPHR